MPTYLPRDLQALMATLEGLDLVGVHSALDDGLTQAAGRGDEHGVGEAALGI
jgi:hypothetical protein